MTLHRALALVAGAFSLLTCAFVPHDVRADDVLIAANDNRTPAGTLTGTTLALDLQAEAGRWHPFGDDRSGGLTEAFAERGHAPQIPGPLVRVAVGTDIRIRLHNALDRTLVIHNLVDVPSTTDRPIRLVPGETRIVRMHTYAPGTYMYWAATKAKSLDDRYGPDANLSGVIVVDPPGAAAHDRIFVLGEWDDVYNKKGAFNRGYSIVTINGRTWPATERLDYIVGDSVTWRIVNASGGTHPMHLHGFPFTVLQRGDGIGVASVHDTREVTEAVPAGGTSVLRWSPDRAGSWMFHCHIAWHTNPARTDGLAHAGSVMPSRPFSDLHVVPTALAGMDMGTLAHMTPGDSSMGGMILAVTTHARAVAATSAARPVARHLTLTVSSDPAPAAAPSLGAPPSVPAMHYTLTENGTMIGAGGNGAPPLILTRGVPVDIDVHNALDEATSVHWHGIDVQDSYDDGSMLTPLHGRPSTLVAPGSDFVARFTPVRAGTFMYHTHADDTWQLIAGLAGPLVVLEPGQHFDPATDHLVMITTPPHVADWDHVAINGALTPAPIAMTAGVEQRLRLLNMTVYQADAVAELHGADGKPITSWTLVARDGLPLASPRSGLTNENVTVGATRDFTLRPTTPGTYTLEIRDGPGGDPLAKVPLVVTAGAVASRTP